MKKVLLSTAALAVLAVSAPAFAQEESGVKLGLGGHFKGYGVWVDQEETVGNSVRSMDMLRDTEVHFSGETTLDNGLTVGAHVETKADQGSSFEVDESYAYFSGSWGRVNVGREDAAAFLLQVAAPSADSNYDGVRQIVNPFNYTGFAALSGGQYDYEQNVSGKDDKVTYLSPVFSGFQAGVSYTPQVDASTSNRLGGTSQDDDTAEYGDAWDVGVRYEGQFNNVDMALGGGYSTSSVEAGDATHDDRKAWNLGADFGMGAVGLGVVYTTDDQGSKGTTNGDVDTWVVGADYTTGPFTLGATYLNQDDTVGTDVETDRYTGGVTYAYGPGMTFRGSVSYIDQDIAGTSTDFDGTAVLLGTQVNF